jgi:hypothetical protein
MLGLVTVSAFVIGTWVTPTTLDIRYDTTGWPSRIETQVGNSIMVMATVVNGYTEIVRDAPVLAVILNDDNIDTIRIRVSVWQKLALSRDRDKIWLDTAFTRGGHIYPLR